MKTAFAAVLAAAALASAQPTFNPAARTHVRIINGVPVKYTSKLTRVVELNFTFGFHHSEGKQVISAALARIAKRYALDGKDAFAVRSIASSSGGAAVGEMVSFTLADLLSGEVMAANNISAFDELMVKSPAQAQAIETALKSEGRGLVGFHGSGDGGGKWKFFTDEIHPVGYKGHGTRSAGPVYKNQATARHLILEDVLESGATLADVPMAVDAAGNEVIGSAVKTRRMMNEWYWFSRNLTTDPVTKSLVTPLLKYDPRSLESQALQPQYRYKGGNLYTYLLRLGAGKATYIPAGHDNGELMASGTSFDGGTGDFDRYLAQTLFFLAGYKTEVCLDRTCEPLPLVDAQDQIVDRSVSAWRLKVAEGRPAFTAAAGEPYAATLVDLAGRVVAMRKGIGGDEVRFETDGLEPGVYSLRVKVGRGPDQVRRLVVAGR